jgi:hypothetical protein
MCHVLGIGRGEQRILESKPEGKRLFERPRRRWEHNIKTNLQRNKRGKLEVNLSGSGWRNVVGYCEDGDGKSVPCFKRKAMLHGFNQ